MSHHGIRYLPSLSGLAHPATLNVFPDEEQKNWLGKIPSQLVLLYMLRQLSTQVVMMTVVAIVAVSVVV